MAEALKKQRATIKGSITRIGNVIKEYNQDTTLENIQVRLAKLEEQINDFNTVQTQLEEYLDTTEDQINEESIRAEVEDRYLDIKAQCLRLINEIQNKATHSSYDIPSSQRDDSLNLAIRALVEHQSALSTAVERLASSSSNILSSTMSFSNHNSDVKLPRIDLPTFTGNYEDWPTFHDLFTSLVHSNNSISGAQKLQYLKSSLKGEASSLLKNLKVDDANYSEAWESLNKRFNKEDCIIEAHLRNLLDQPSHIKASAIELKKFITVTNDAVSGLKAQKVPVEHWDAILIHISLGKLDVDIKRLWLREVRGRSRPKFEQFMEFLESISFEQEMLKRSRHTTANNQLVSKKVLTASILSCPSCKGQHLIGKCPAFLAMNINERKGLIMSKFLCTNCLRSGHKSTNCKSSHCRICNSKHHTLIHTELKSPQAKTPANTSTATSLATQLEVKPQSTHATLLPTAIILIQDITGQSQPCRALLDSGSQITLISEACVQRLGLKRTHTKVHISGIGATQTKSTRGKITVHIRSRFNDEAISTAALILSSLTGMLPAAETTAEQLSYFSNINLADPDFYRPGRIDIIIGAELFFQVLTEGRLTHPSGSLTAHNSIFGWIISGQLLSSEQETFHTLHSCIDIDQQLRRFWEVEEIASQACLTEEERKCEQHFIKTHQRLQNGIYQVRLPFKEDKEVLGESRNSAIQRLYAMERKFKHNHELRQQYQDFMAEYVELGHMSRTNADEEYSKDNYYMPHHAVLKPKSTTTKLRVVFDASCKTSTGIALNDNLMVGATIQSDIVSLLIRFRRHKYAFTADIAKMYRQILMDEQDWKYQSILWRNHPTEPVQEYKLRTVTYGTSSAPFLATRTLHQLSIEEASRYPIASEVIRSDFYVDDLMSGASTFEQAHSLQKNLINMLKSAGFELRKWSSNFPELLEDIPENHRERSTQLSFDKTTTVNTLGLKWDTTNDCFLFKVCLRNSSASTKREILSDIAKIFDPLGWLSPCVINVKILLQQIWILGIEWDDPMPEPLAHTWSQFRNTLPELSALKLPRWMSSEAETIQLHGFSDASERAYAAAIYICTFTEGRSKTINLVAAKTKVAPMKQLTLPRLELCAAHLLTKLLKKVQMAMQLPHIQCFGWTDSTVVLSWLSDHPRRWKTFVGNRTAEILDVLPVKYWRHISSQDNPADCASRGISPIELLNCTLWWKGPDVLQEEIPMSNDFKEHAGNKSIVDTEARISIFHTRLINNMDELLHRYSTLTRLKRIASYCLRFRKNCNSKSERVTGALSTQELNDALDGLLKCAQNKAFHAEVAILCAGKQLHHKNKLAPLNPFLDSNGILRVGGRLNQADLAYNTKHPIILSKTCQLSSLIIADLHIRYLHAGQQQILNSLHTRYWILGARNLVKRCIYKSIICTKIRARPYSQQMGSLPSYRLQAAYPFLNTGVDYAGPVLVKSWKGRGAKTFKAYIALFICLATKAIHLELCSDISTESFIAALKRFVARRGICSNIFSDNGTNFVGADRYLRELAELIITPKHNEIVSNFLSDSNIQWHFIPPSAPHFGGLWEAGIKSMKSHLRRVTGNVSLTFEEYGTLLCQIEACLNSRPLVTKSSNAEDCEVLTPGHFLIGRSIVQVPEVNLEALNIKHMARWQLIQRLNQEFWRRWSTEYITQLQQRSRWRTKAKNPEVGDVVILKDDNLPPCRWSIGRISQIHPGADNLVRVVSVRTSKGLLKRPVVKLCPLPVDVDIASDVEGRPFKAAGMFGTQPYTMHNN